MSEQLPSTSAAAADGGGPLPGCDKTFKTTEMIRHLLMSNQFASQPSWVIDSYRDPRCAGVATFRTDDLAKFEMDEQAKNPSKANVAACSANGEVAWAVWL